MIKHRAASLLTGSLALGAGLILATPASADCASSSQLVCAEANVQLSVGDSTPGGTDTVTFPEDAGKSADVFVQSTPIFVGSAVGNAQNIATLTFQIPAGLAPGLHHVIVHGTLNGVAYVSSLPLTLTTPTAIGDTGGRVHLPKTGSSNVVPLTELGLGLVVVGGGVLMLARRRRSATATPLAA